MAGKDAVAIQSPSGRLIPPDRIRPTDSHGWWPLCPRTPLTLCAGSRQKRPHRTQIVASNCRAIALRCIRCILYMPEACTLQIAYDACASMALRASQTRVKENPTSSPAGRGVGYKSYCSRMASKMPDINHLRITAHFEGITVIIPFCPHSSHARSGVTHIPPLRGFSMHVAGDACSWVAGKSVDWFAGRDLWGVFLRCRNYRTKKRPPSFLLFFRRKPVWDTKERCVLSAPFRRFFR